MRNCERLDGLLKAESKLIRKHLANHKWYQHIQNDEEAIKDFIDKYGWVMREFYCGSVCGERRNCEIARQYLYLNGTSHFNGEMF